MTKKRLTIVMDFEGKIKPDGETSFIDLSSCNQVPFEKQVENALGFKKTNKLVIRQYDHLVKWRIYNKVKTAYNQKVTL